MFESDTLTWVTVAVAVGLVTHFALLVALPHIVARVLRKKVIRGRGDNALYYQEPPTPAARAVPIPCPDLAYLIGFFDLSRGPLALSAPTHGSYASLAIFAKNMDNFYVKNDRQVNGRFEVVLVGPGAPTPTATGADVVQTPGPTGIVLFRYFAGDARSRAAAEAITEDVRCGLVAS
jgi:uncharacterized membrane protein